MQPRGIVETQPRHSREIAETLSRWGWRPCPPGLLPSLRRPLPAPVLQAGGICESLLNCLTGETSATRSIEIGNKQDKGQIPPSKPCTAAGKILPQPTKDYVKSIREKNGYVAQL